ncbi:MAG: hypothetical protein AB1457_03045 [Chloroflexota bacterium]
MGRKFLHSYWFWYFSGIIFALIVMQFQKGPGYMDSAYYTVGGLQLFEGNGFIEPFIWNYLADPKGIPAPAFVYWMPLPSLLTFLGMWLGRSPDFFWARLFFLLLTGLLPVISVYLTKSMLREPEHSWIAGGLAVFPGVYTLYLTIPETFVPYMVGGGVFLIIAFTGDNPWIGGEESFRRFFLLGMIAGWMHLTRADGLIWLVSALGVVIWRTQPWQTVAKLRIAISGIIGIILGYLILTGLWYYRNWMVFGALIPPGNSKSLWLTSYNQLYAFPNDHLNVSNWLRSGWPAIFRARLDSLILNLQNFLVVQGSVVLVPLILAGFWNKRKSPMVLFGILMGVLNFGLMTFVFPFAGARGGYLHSGASLQIFLWSMAIVGLERLIHWMKKVRGWNTRTAMSLFGSFLVFLNLFIAVWFLNQRIFGDDNTLIWNKSIDQYQKVGERLTRLNISMDAIGMVNNPPGFYWATRRPSIVIPDGDITHALAAAKQFGATYLLLEVNQENLIELYLNPRDLEGIRYVGTYDNVHYFWILQDTKGSMRLEYQFKN